MWGEEGACGAQCRGVGGVGRGQRVWEVCLVGHYYGKAGGGRKAGWYDGRVAGWQTGKGDRWRGGLTGVSLLRLLEDLL